MAAEAGDIACIKDEDVLRRMITKRYSAPPQFRQEPVRSVGSLMPYLSQAGLFEKAPVIHNGTLMHCPSRSMMTFPVNATGSILRNFPTNHFEESKWQSTEDFARKKEIRARMYKLREQRLKEFYTTGEVLSDVQSVTPEAGDTGSKSDIIPSITKHSDSGAMTLTDSIEDQGFMAMKSKEIRDSESPTRALDLSQSGRDNNVQSYWKVESSSDRYEAVGSGGQYEVTSQSQRRSMAGENDQVIMDVSTSSGARTLTDKDGNRIVMSDGNFNSDARGRSLTTAYGKLNNGDTAVCAVRDGGESRTTTVSEKMSSGHHSSSQQSQKWSSSTSRSASNVVTSSSYSTEGMIRDLTDKDVGDVWIEEGPGGVTRTVRVIKKSDNQGDQGRVTKVTRIVKTTGSSGDFMDNESGGVRTVTVTKTTTSRGGPGDGGSTKITETRIVPSSEEYWVQDGSGNSRRVVTTIVKTSGVQKEGHYAADNSGGTVVTEKVVRTSGRSSDDTHRTSEESKTHIENKSHITEGTINRDVKDITSRDRSSDQSRFIRNEQIESHVSKAEEKSQKSFTMDRKEFVAQSERNVTETITSDRQITDKPEVRSHTDVSRQHLRENENISNLDTQRRESVKIEKENVGLEHSRKDTENRTMIMMTDHHVNERKSEVDSGKLARVVQRGDITVETDTLKESHDRDERVSIHTKHSVDGLRKSPGKSPESDRPISAKDSPRGPGKEPQSHPVDAPRGDDRPTGKEPQTHRIDTPRGDDRPTGKEPQTHRIDTPRGDDRPAGKEPQGHRIDTPRGDDRPAGKEPQTHRIDTPRGDDRPAGKEPQTHRIDTPRGDDRPTGKEPQTHRVGAPRGDDRPTGKEPQNEYPRGTDEKPTGKRPETSDFSSPQPGREPVRDDREQPTEGRTYTRKESETSDTQGVKKTGSYTTTYQWSFTPQKINVEVSASHAAFASSLRAPSLSPERAFSPFRSSSDITYTCGRSSPTKSTSRSSLERNTQITKKSYSPEPRKSSRTSPTKTSKSPTQDHDRKPTTKDRESPKAKATPVTIDGRPIGKSPKDSKSPVKDKRKLSGTRRRSGTPGVSPSTSPERDAKPEKTRKTSSSSESSRHTYNRQIKETKEEKYRGVTDFIQTERADREPKNTPRAPAVEKLREKSPEYSSDGSLAQELYPNKSHKQAPTPQVKGFTPIRDPNLRPRGPSSSSSPSTSPERKLIPKKGVPDQKPTNIIKNKDTSKKHPADKQKPEQTTPGRKISQPQDHKVTPDGRKVPKTPGTRPEDEPEQDRVTPDGRRVPQKPGTRPGDEPDDYDVTPDGRRKPGTRPGDEPDDYDVTPDGRRVPKKPGTRPEDEPEQYRVTPDGRRVPKKPGTRPGDEPDDYDVTPDGRRVPKTPGTRPEDEPEQYRVTPDGRRVPKKPGTRPGDEPDDYYVTPDGRRVPKKPGTRPGDESDDYDVTPDGQRVPKKPGTRPGDEPEQYRVTPDGRRVPKKPGTKPGDEPDDYDMTPDGRRVPKTPGTRPEDEPEQYKVTPDGRRVPIKPGTRPRDEPDDYDVTPDGRRVPKKPGTSPGDEPDDYVTPDGRRKPGTRPGDKPDDYDVTPDGRRVPKKPGTRPGDEPDDYDVTPDGRRVPKKPGTSPGDEPDDYDVTPDGRRKPGTRPGDEPDDYDVTPDGRRVPKKPGSRPADEPEQYRVTPDGRRVPKKPGTRPGDEPDDYDVTPDGRRVPKKPGTRAEDEPEQYRVTPDGRRVPKKPGTKPGDEPDDYDVTPDGRRKPGTRPGDEPDDYDVTPDGRRVPKKPGTRSGDEPDDYDVTPDGRREPGTRPEDEPDDYDVTPDGRRVPKKPGTRPGNEPEQYRVTPDGRRVPKKPGDEPDDYYVTPDGRRVPKKPGTRPGDKPDDYDVTPDGRRVPKKPGSRPEDEPEQYRVTPDGRRVPKKPGTRPGDEPDDYDVTPDGRRKPGTRPGDEPDDYDVTPDGRRVPKKPGTRPGDKPDDYDVTPDGRRVPKKPGSRPEDEPEQYRVTPDGRRVPKKPGTKPGDEPDDYDVTPDGRRVPKKPGTRPEDEPEQYRVTPDGRRVPRKPGTKPGDEPDDYDVTPDGRRVPKKPGTRLGDKPDDYDVTPDGRRVPKKPGSRPEDKPEQYRVTPDGRRVLKKPGTRPGDEPDDYDGYPDGRKHLGSPDDRVYDEDDELQEYVTGGARNKPRKSGEIDYDEDSLEEYITEEGKRIMRRKVDRIEHRESIRRHEIVDEYDYDTDENKPEKKSPYQRDNKPESKSRVTPGGKRVPEASKPSGRVPGHDHVTPDGRQVSGMKPRIKPTDKIPDKQSATPTKKPGDKNVGNLPGKKTDLRPGEKTPAAGRTIPGRKPSGHEYVTPDGRTVTGKRPVGKSVPSTPEKKPSTNRLISTPKTIPTKPDTKSTPTPTTKKPERGYISPTKKPVDTPKTPVGRSKLMPDPTRKAPAVPAKPMTKKPGADFGDGPRRRSSATVTDFIRNERRTELRQQRVEYEFDDEQLSDYPVDDEEPVPDDVPRKQPKSTRATSGPILTPKDKIQAKKPMPQQKSEPKIRPGYGNAPKPKTTASTLRKEPVGKTQPSGRPKQPTTKDSKKQKPLDSETSEEEEEMEYMRETRYSEERQYTLTEQQKIKKKQKGSPDRSPDRDGMLTEPKGIVEFPESPREVSPERKPRLTPVNSRRVEELIPRYPDSVTEPEDESDEEYRPRRLKNRPDTVDEEEELQRRKQKKTPEPDEPSDDFDETGVSVAQRVNKFMDAARKAGSSPLPSRPEDITLKGLDDTINSYMENNDFDEDVDSVNAVRKAKTMFENIAYTQVNTTARRELQRQDDILSRPSVFDARRKDNRPEPEEEEESQPQKRVPELSQERKPLEPEALRKENLLKLGLRCCPEDILNQNLFEKPGKDTFPRRKTPSPDRPVGKFDTFPTRKSPVKDDEPFSKRATPERAESPEKTKRPEEPQSVKSMPKLGEGKPVTSRYPFSKPKPEDKLPTQKPLKNTSVTSRYPFSDKPKESGRPKLNGYVPSGKQPSSRIPEDSDLKSPALLKEPIYSTRKEPLDDRYSPDRREGSPFARRPSDISGTGRPDSPKKGIPDKTYGRKDKMQSPTGEYPNRAGRRPTDEPQSLKDRTPTNRGPLDRTSPDSRSRTSPGRRYPDERSPTDTRRYPSDSSPGRRSHEKDFPDDRSPTGRRPSGKSYPEDRTSRTPSPDSRMRKDQYPERRRPSERDFPSDRSPTGRRPSGKSYPEDRTSRTPSPDSRIRKDQYPERRRPSERDFPSDRSPTGRRPSGKSYPEDRASRTPSPDSRLRKNHSPERRRPSQAYDQNDKPKYKSPSPTRTAYPEQRPKDKTPDLYGSRPSRDKLFDDLQEQNVDEVKISKFGVSLRKTTSGSSIMKKLFADVGKKESELDRIFDLEVLETLLERAKGYDERRLIRQQIRLVKKMIENGELPEQPSGKRSEPDVYDSIHPKDHDSPFLGSDRVVKKDLGRTSKSPEKAGFDRKSPEKTQPGRFEPVGPGRRHSEDKYYNERDVRRQSTDRTEHYTSSVQMRTSTTTTTTTRKTSDLLNKTVKKSYIDDDAREESLTDSITSSYGIGPTDEKGMPLFGLKALRRQNKGAPDMEPEPAPFDEEPSPRDIKDSSGRPLFGLKALQISKSPTRKSEDNQTPEPGDKTPLKDLVNRHDKQARGNAVSQPQQYAPSRMRDNLARNEEFIRRESEAEDARNVGKDRGQSLRAMIQRHESLTESDRKRPEVTTTSSSFSSSTVVRSSAVRKPDGGVSIKSQMVQGETISKNGEKPKSRVLTAEYSYETPEDGVEYGSDEERHMTRKSVKTVSTRSNTTESVSSRTSRKSLSPERKSPEHYPTEDGTTKTRRPISDKLSHLSRKFSKEPEDAVRKTEARSEPHYSSHTRSSLLHSNVLSSTTTSVSSRYQPDDDASSRRRSSTPQDDTSMNRRRSSTPLDELKESLFRKSSASHEETDSSSTLFTRYGRGGAVKALSQKFQNAGAEADSPKSSSSYPKAGLILRSASFKHTNGDLTPPDSPAYKQSVSMEPQVGTPTRSGTTTSRMTTDERRTDGSRRWSRDGENDYDGSSEISSRVVTRTVTETTDGRSFLGSNTKVTGVKDILTRMKAADTEDSGLESPEDIHARSLLNKFLGASVMMSGMEPLVKAAGNSSASLVSQVERQRILQSSPTDATVGKDYVITETFRDYDDIDNIWDEKKLRQLLDACTDYEGRRKIRARLRTVMAEKSACEDLVAATQEEENLKSGDGSKTMQAGESLLPYLVERLRTSLILESLPNQKTDEGFSVAHMEDSGTESGEDLRLLVGLRDSIYDGKGVKKTEQLNKKLLTEVQEALQKLQTSLTNRDDNSLDPITRETLLQLVTRLQSSLKMAPGIGSETKSPNRNRFANRRLARQNRHTVGVTQEELADARRLIQESPLINFDKTKTENATRAESEQPLAPYAVVKQNSADDVTSNPSAPVKLFRPVHFNPGKLKLPAQPNNPPKPFLSSKQIQSADEWVRNQIGSAKGPNEGCSAPSSNYSTPACLSPSSGYEFSTPAAVEAKSDPFTIPKPLSPPYKNIQYAPAVFNQFEPMAKTSPDNISLQALARSKSVGESIIETRARSPVKQSMSADNGDSVLEYDPSLRLFTPEQSVKIAVHKAAINKQLSQEEEKRMRKLSIESDLGSTEDEAMEEDGDISSVSDDEDEPTMKMTKTYQPSQLNNQKPKISVKEQTDRRNSEMDNARYKYVKEDRKYEDKKEPLNRFEKRIQEIQNERKAGSRQNVRSIEELQKIYLDRKEKEKEMERKMPDPRSQVIQDVQAKYQKSLHDMTPAQKTFSPQRLNPEIRSKYENEIRRNTENDIRSKPIWNEDDSGRRRRESLKHFEYFNNAPEHNDLHVPTDISQTDSEISVSSTSTENSISHAQKLLRLATGDKSGKSPKKVKMRRANTIDIPKPMNYYDIDYSDYTDDEQGRDSYTSTVKSMKPSVPILEPKTESDKKFLAFLRQQNPPKVVNAIWMKDHEPNRGVSFPEHQWGNRFTRIKTAFENVKPEGPFRGTPVASAVSGARAFWKSADDSAAVLKTPKDPKWVDRTKFMRQGSTTSKIFQREEKQARLPWMNQENVVVGTLTVYPTQDPAKINKPNVNQFSHAPMSAFRPVERKVENAKTFHGVAPKITKPTPVFPNKQEPVPSLPWLKEKPAEKTLNNAVAKFENLSSTEASPVMSPKPKIQDRTNFVPVYVEPQMPPRPIIPSQSGVVQARTQAFTSSYPHVKCDAGLLGERAKPSKQDIFSPVTTYSVDVAATNTVYDLQPEKSDPFEYFNDSLVSTPEEQMAVTKVMVGPVQQKAVTISQKAHRKNEDDDNRTTAAKSLTNMLQRFSSPPSDRVPEQARPRGSIPDINFPKSSLLPPNLPTGKSSPISPDKRSLSPSYPEEKPYRSALGRPSSAESLNKSNSSEELRENGETGARLQIPTSPNQYRTSSLQDLSPQGSPTSGLRKSESCHQINGLKPKRPQSLILPDLPAPQRKTPTSLSKTKSSHALSFPKQFEAVLNPKAVEMKQKTVEEYFTVKKRTKKNVKKDFVELDDNLENVDEAFDALFSTVASSAKINGKSDFYDGFRPANNLNQISKSVSTSSIQHSRNTSSSITTTTTKSGDSGYSKITSEKTVFSSYGSSKAASTNKPISPFAKFQQLDRQSSGSSSTPSSPSGGKGPLFTFTDPKLSRSASGVKDRLLQWCQSKTKSYKNIQIENFSTSWSNGLAFCALIHHFRPEAFDYDALTPKERRKNFELAFRVADEEAGIAPLLDVEDMVMMRKPDWKCVFTYVQSIYCRFKNED